MNGLVEHHIKYKEIDGVDETVFLTPTEHIILHKARIKGGAKPIPKQVISRAYSRTEKARKHRYNILDRIVFTETVSKGIQQHEEIIYNNKNGNVYYHLHFRGHGIIKGIKKELLEVNV